MTSVSASKPTAQVNLNPSTTALSNQQQGAGSTGNTGSSTGSVTGQAETGGQTTTPPANAPADGKQWRNKPFNTIAQDFEVAGQQGVQAVERNIRTTHPSVLNQDNRLSFDELKAYASNPENHFPYPNVNLEKFFKGLDVGGYNQTGQYEINPNLGGFLEPIELGARKMMEDGGRLDDPNRGIPDGFIIPAESKAFEAYINDNPLEVLQYSTQEILTRAFDGKTSFQPDPGRALLQQVAKGGVSYSLLDEDETYVQQMLKPFYTNPNRYEELKKQFTPEELNLLTTQLANAGVTAHGKKDSAGDANGLDPFLREFLVGDRKTTGNHAFAKNIYDTLKETWQLTPTGPNGSYVSGYEKDATWRTEAMQIAKLVNELEGKTTQNTYPPTQPPVAPTIPTTPPTVPTTPVYPNEVWSTSSQTVNQNANQSALPQAFWTQFEQAMAGIGPSIHNSVQHYVHTMLAQFGIQAV